MPYRICKMIEVENGHLLSKHPDKCRFPHGHTRKVELVFEANSLDDREMVFDFKLIGRMIGDFLETYDHALCMNTEDPKFDFFKEAYGERIIGFESEDPTTEVMARTIYQHTKASLHQFVNDADPDYPVRAEVRISKIRVWETTSSWAEYAE
ncbi:MAG: 6-carboxytetrahydropterin synthase [Akkermansiaceae bacterium]|nr:6-carboxytetrahydropterin synthase [Akkermansiaceae bacterium]